MSSGTRAERLHARLAGTGLEQARLVPQLIRYLEILARWNRRMNLTAFDLDDLPDAAIDRLIVEPLVGARLIAPDDRLLVDIGSGGGSPALPLKIAVPSLRMVLVEARTRKSAFLREAIRTLELRDVDVETGRFGSDGYPALNGRTDIVTMRAVRPDADVWSGVARLVRPQGRFFWFGGVEAQPPAGWSRARPEPAAGTFLDVLTKL